MKKRISVSLLDVCPIAITLAAALALPIVATAQDQPAQEHKDHHPRYRFVDLGTFGGHHSEVDGGSVVINNHGTVLGEPMRRMLVPTFRTRPSLQRSNGKTAS